MGWLHSTVRLDIPVDPAFDRTGRTSHSPEGEPKTSSHPSYPVGGRGSAEVLWAGCCCARRPVNRRLGRFGHFSTLRRQKRPALEAEPLV